MKKLLCLLTLFFILTVQMVWTQTPIAIKGVAIDSEGMPIPDGNKKIIFTLYDSREGNTVVWQEEQTVPVEDGYFIAALGKVNDLDLSFEEPYWLGLQIGDGEEMKPRMKVNKMGGDFTMTQKRKYVTDAGQVNKKTAIDRDGATETTEPITSAPMDQVISDDLIVTGSLCVGFDCVNGESFGFDTIKLKENNLRIKFQDTSTSASFPSNDWQISANESANGGKNKFSIDDIDHGRTPFTIEANARSHALYVKSYGKIGLGTSDPATALQIKYNDTPTIRLEQDNSAGWRPQTWDVAGNETNFFIRDATNGSKLPFRIQPGASTNALYINSSDKIGLGSSSPIEKLHVDNGNIIIYDSNTGDATDYGIIFSDGTFQTTASGGGGGGVWTQNASDIYYNSGNVGIGTDTPIAALHISAEGAGLAIDSPSYTADDNLKWVLSQHGYWGTFGIYKHDDENGIIGGPIFEIKTDNNIYANGNLAHSSDVRFKKNIKTIGFAMDKVKRLRGVEFDWRVNEFENRTFSEDHQIGFIAQEVEAIIPEFVLTNDDGYKSVTYANVTALLVEAIKEQQEIINEQRAHLDAIGLKVLQLETLMKKFTSEQTKQSSGSGLKKANSKTDLSGSQLQKTRVEPEIDENGRPVGITPTQK